MIGRIDADAGADAAASGKVANHNQPARLKQFKQVCVNPVGYVFVERSFVAEGKKEQLERLAFHAHLIGNVFNGDARKIGLPGDREVNSSVSNWIQ